MSILPDFSRQYQPPKIPTHWSADERRFAQGVTDVLDDIYLRYGRMSKKDLSPTLSKEISDASGNIVQLQLDASGLTTRMLSAEGSLSTLEQTAESLTTNYSTLEGDYSEFKQTAEGFHTRVSDAEGNISTLEQTATSFGTRISDAEGNISTLEQTATSFGTRITNAEGAISIAQQQADKIQWLVASGTSAANMTLTSQLYSLMAANIDLSANNSIKLAVSSIQVGGNNLIKNGDFTQGTYSSWTNWVVYSDAVLSKHSSHVDKTKQSGNVTCLAPDTAAGIYQTVPCPDTGGKELTFSMYGYLMGTIITRHGSGNCGLITQYNSGGTEITGTQTQLFLSDFGPYDRPNSWYRLVKTFTPHADCASLRVLFVIRSDGTNDNNMIVTNFQLEKGNKATDWSPAPSDPASGVKTASITIGDGGIDLAASDKITVNGGEFIATKANSITQTATNSIVSTVKSDSDWLGKGAADERYSQITQTNDSIKLAVTSQSANLFPSDPSNWTQGTISSANGSNSASTTRIRSVDYITLNAGTLYTVSRVKSLTGQIYLHYYNSSNAYIGNSGAWVTTYPYSFSLPSGATKMRVIVRTAADGTIVPTDVPGILFSIVPAGVSGGVKTSKVTINDTGIDMTTGGTFTVGSQNFSIDAAGNVTVKGTIIATSGTIGGITIRSNALSIGKTSASDPSAGMWLDSTGLSLGDLRISESGYFFNNYFTFKAPNNGNSVTLALNTNVLGTGTSDGSMLYSFHDYSASMNSVDGKVAMKVPNVTAAKLFVTYRYYTTSQSTTMYVSSDLYCDYNCSALSFTDRTPAYTGNALDELRWVRGNRAQGIDHNSIPPFARKTIKNTRTLPDGTVEHYHEPGRDLGAMISILTKAVQEIDDRMNAFERRLPA